MLVLTKLLQIVKNKNPTMHITLRLMMQRLSKSRPNRRRPKAKQLNQKEAKPKPEQRESEQREPEQREPEQREPEQRESDQRDKVSHRRTRSYVDPGSRGGGKVISEPKRRTKKQIADQVREELKELQNMDNEKEETANQKLNQSAFSSSEQSASSSDKQLVSLQKSKTPKKSDKHDHVVALEQFSPPERIRHAEPTTAMAPPLALDMS
uniref:Uncharacterized protein n=1 Tax=Ciona savignyi TaxID=51511 RepID=H2Z9B5_CIOSA